MQKHLLNPTYDEWNPLRFNKAANGFETMSHKSGNTSVARKMLNEIIYHKTNSQALSSVNWCWRNKKREVSSAHSGAQAAVQSFSTLPSIKLYRDLPPDMGEKKTKEIFLPIAFAAKNCAWKMENFYRWKLIRNRVKETNFAEVFSWWIKRLLYSFALQCHPGVSYQISFVSKRGLFWASESFLGHKNFVSAMPQAKFVAKANREEAIVSLQIKLEQTPPSHLDSLQFRDLPAALEQTSA